MPLKIRFRHTSTVLLLHRGPRGGGVSASAFGSLPLSLYIRVESSFYTHRKTLRLKALIGESAFWVPPRLWAYAAGHQPDGCFKDYTATEIAMLICYPGDAKVMLEALIKAGFVDKNPLRIHDWHEYNGVLDFFSKRAKKAAEARWEKERSKEKESKTDQIRSEHSRSEASIASSNASSMAINHDIERKIQEIHLWYSETRGGEIRLDEFNKRLWFEFFRAGYSGDDFKRVFKSKNAMVIEGDHPAALHLKNLLAPDRFPDFLADARNGAVKQPRSGVKSSTESLGTKLSGDLRKQAEKARAERPQ